eukprot:scaffold62517_cov66-Phaeocystis_antarctica.AAC.1
MPDIGLCSLVNSPKTQPALSVYGRGVVPSSFNRSKHKHKTGPRTQPQKSRRHVSHADSRNRAL